MPKIREINRYLEELRSVGVAEIALKRSYRNQLVKLVREGVNENNLEKFTTEELEVIVGIIER